MKGDSPLYSERSNRALRAKSIFPARHVRAPFPIERGRPLAFHAGALFSRDQDKHSNNNNSGSYNDNNNDHRPSTNVHGFRRATTNSKRRHAREPADECIARTLPVHQLGYSDE